MKPDWKDAPEWANYLAMDEDGTWYWYENEPKLFFGSVWKNSDAGGRFSDADVCGYSWRESLE